MQKRMLIAIALLGGFGMAGLAQESIAPAWAGHDTAEEEDPAELARQGMERMLRALNLMIEMIPQYEMPQVLENGDIIIRRKRHEEHEEEEPGEDEALDETRT